MKNWIAVIAAALLVVVTVKPSLYVEAAGTGQSAVQSASSQQASAAQETVPRLVQFNGTLKDSAARAVSGVASVTFAIYAEQDGGAALWTETQNVLADANGHYTALLGTATTGGFPAELIGKGESRWLGVSLARQEEAPRVLLASVPYALKAGDADTLGGLPASSYVTTSQLAASNARPATNFLSGGGTTIVAASGAATPGVAAGPTSTDAALSSVIDATPTGSGTTDFIPLWTSGSNLGNSILFQTGGKLGLGITTPLSTLDINGGEILRGGFYEYPEDVATPSNGGRPSHSFQWLASAYNSNSKSSVDYAFGFKALPVGNNTATPSAKLDLFYGAGGPTGTIADTGLSIDSIGNVTLGAGQTLTAATANLTDLSISDQISVSTSEFYAINSTSTAVDGFGLYGTDTQMYGFGIGGTGMYSGVYGTGQEYAGEFDGELFVSGNIAKSGGSFKIDHPLDPANKYLYHSFVESPDMKNVYDGVVTTDANGLAVITMPDWFGALNRDFRYQLTSIGQHADAWIETEIANNQFTIRTEKPNVRVSWQVTGIRQDAYANAYRIPVEQDKTDAEKGHYIRPELFGHTGEASLASMRPGPDGKLIPIQQKSAPNK